MDQGDIEVIEMIFRTHSDSTKEFIKLAMDDVKLNIAESSSNTDRQIIELNKTLKEHNGRLKEVEIESEKHSKVIKTLNWIAKHWYVAAGVVILIIFIAIPLVEVLGLKGIISIFK